MSLVGESIISDVFRETRHGLDFVLDSFAIVDDVIFAGGFELEVEGNLNEENKRIRNYCCWKTTYRNL